MYSIPLPNKKQKQKGGIMERFQELKPTIEQKAYVRSILREEYAQNKNTRDTEERERFYGYLGETIVSDIFEVQRPQTRGADEGYDVIYNGVKIDVKVRACYYKPKEEYYAKLYLRQAQDNNCDYVLFLSYNPKADVFYVLGIMSVKGFLNFAELKKKGQDVRTDDGKLLYTIEDEGEEQYLARIKDLAICELSPEEKVFRYEKS